jgi:hypothetical protein
VYRLAVEITVHIAPFATLVAPFAPILFAAGIADNTLGD